MFWSVIFKIKNTFAVMEHEVYNISNSVRHIFKRLFVIMTQNNFLIVKPVSLFFILEKNVEQLENQKQQ